MTAPTQAPAATARSHFIEELRLLLDASVLSSVDDEVFENLLGQLPEFTSALQIKSGPFPWFWNAVADPASGPGMTLGEAWGTYNPIAPRLKTRSVDGRLEGTFKAGPALGGPPGMVHGGIVATLLDQAMGGYLASINRPSVTATMTVDYRNGTPLLQTMDLEAGHHSIEGRKATAWARISLHGKTTAEATGLFILVPENSDDGT